MRPGRFDRNRRGSALMTVILLLSLLVLVTGVMAKLGLAERAQARAEERRMRAAWLAESGLERAWSKLRSDPDYRGESWEHPAESLGGPHGALVLIRVEPDPARPGTLRVVSRADYPRDGSNRARQSRTVLIPANDSSPTTR